MTIPFSFPEIRPPLVQTGGAPDPTDQFLRYLIGGMQQGQAAHQFQQGLALDKQRLAQQAAQESARLQLAQDAEQRQAAAAAARLTADRAAGQAILNWLQKGAPANERPAAIDQMGQPSTTTTSGTPGAPAMATTVAGPPNPLAGLRESLQGVPPEAINDAVLRLVPLVNAQAQFDQEQAKFARINAAVANIKDPARRGAVVTWLGIIEGGANPTPDQLSVIAPQLATINPGTMNAATEMWKDSGQPWARVRSAFRLPKSQLPDDMVYTAPGSKKMNDAQLTMLMQVPELEATAANMSRLEAAGVRVGSLASIVKANPGAMSDMLNKLAHSDEQREYISNQLRWAGLITYTLTGKAATIQERVRVLNDFNATGSDPATVVEQKRTARTKLTMAARDIALGSRTAAEVLASLSEDPFLNNRQRGQIGMLRQTAAEYEKAVREGRAQMPVSTNPATPDTIGSDSAWVANALRGVPDSALGGRRRAHTPPVYQYRPAPPTAPLTLLPGAAPDNNLLNALIINPFAGVRP